MKELIEKHFPFDEFRDGQFNVIQTILEQLFNQKKDYFVYEGPTGTGKSVIGWTASKAFYEMTKNVGTNKGGSPLVGPKIIICTSTRQLQNQYVDTFLPFGAQYIWSSKNYDCPYHDPEQEVHYGDAACLRKNCPKNNECGYIIQKRKFKSAAVGITNYHYILHSCEFIPSIFVMDEAHNLEKILCDVSTLKLSEHSFKRLITSINDISQNINLNINTYTGPIRQMCKESESTLENVILKDYCKTIMNEFFTYKRDLEGEVKVFTDERDEIIETGSQPPKDLDVTIAKYSKVIDSLDNINEKLDKYISSQASWVVSEKDSKKIALTVKPLTVNEEMQKLNRRCNKMIFLSATICGHQQFMKDLDMDISKASSLESPCIFPVDNRWIYTLGLGSLNYRNKDQLLPKFIRGIDWILEKMTDNWKTPYNGIIHTVSYANAEFIKQNSKYKDRIIIPRGEEMFTLNETIKDNSKNGIIIASPSILEGVDLIGDLSRFQIFLKVPYPDLKDRWIKTRMDMDNKWYSRSTIIKIVQGAGRSIRSETDWAWTFILDSNFNRLLYTDRELFPKWFLEAIQVLTVNI